jgi:hypothetical protein
MKVYADKRQIKLFIFKAVLTLLREILLKFCTLAKDAPKEGVGKLTPPQKATFIFNYKTSTTR